MSLAAMDESLALRKVLQDCQMSTAAVDHIIGMGYTSIALLANAVGAESNLDEFVKHVSPVPEGETFQQFSPQTASIRRSVKECLALSMVAGRASFPEPPVLPLPRAKMTSSEYKELKDQFLTNYPGELLTPSNTPSLAFLSFVKDAVDSKTLSWIPWTRRSSESDELEYSEHRRPRTDKQLIRSILADGDIGFDDLPEAKVDTGGPVESVLSKFQVVLANALAIAGACHLVVIKRFHQKFLELALQKPRDQHLRPPSLAEIIDAERAAWIAVAELMSEGRWTLNDSLSEPR